MNFLSIILLIPTAFTVAAQETVSISEFDCGNDISDASHHLIANIKKLHLDQHVVRRGMHHHHNHQHHHSLQPRDMTVIPTVFHIITSTAQVSSVTEQMTQAQLATLNAAYRTAGFQFRLINMTWTRNNDAWASAGNSQDLTALQTALRQGSYATLNLYFLSDLASGILGRCSMPTDLGPKPSRASYLADGCFAHAATMPGGSMAGYALGMTAAHEAGHWLGLLHVFEGYSCKSGSANPGDYIADTPMQSTSTSGCPISPPKDSCPDQPGLDSVHNIMDYSVDSCYTGFTPLQIQRMRTFWGIYRQGK